MSAYCERLTPVDRPRQATSGLGALLKAVDDEKIIALDDSAAFGRLWYGEPNAVENAIGYAKHRSRSHDAVICVCDDAGNVIETHEHKGDFREP
jgi:hypothetical protein